MKILHVDDESDIREIAKMAIEIDPDLEVMSAPSGSIALQTTDREKPDMFLLDVMMPEMDGPEVLRQLRGKAGLRDTIAIFMTARTQPHHIDELLADGAIAVIPKPFDPMALAAQLRDYLIAPT